MSAFKLYGYYKVRRKATLIKLLLLVPFFGYITIVWLTVRHSTKVCFEKRQRYDTQVLHQFLVNGSVALPKNFTINDLISMKLTERRIKGDIIDQSIQDHRYFLLEPLMDFPKLHRNTVFVFVQSGPTNYKKRRRIRETWADRTAYDGFYPYTPIRVIFTMGLSPNVFISNQSDPALSAVLMEATETKDILLLNMIDMYDNLTTKGFLTMLWLASHGHHIKYILKTDDDVMLNSYAFLQVVEKLRSHGLSCVLVGCIWQNPWVIRTGKYKVSETEYSYDHYPSFASGSAYLMTRKAMVVILEAAFNLPFLTRDDPFFAGLIPKLTDVPMITFPYSSYIVEEGFSSTEKLEKKGVALLHSPKSELWLPSWNMFKKHKRYGYPKNYKTVLLMSRNRGSKYAIPLMVHTTSSETSDVPSEWNLPSDACLGIKCDTKLNKIYWQIPS